MRKHWLVLLGAGISITLGGTALIRSMRLHQTEETRTPPDLLLTPESPSGFDLRLRILHVRRGGPELGPGWTRVGGRFEGPSGPLACPPPVTYSRGTIPRLVLGSGTEVKTWPLQVSALTGEFELLCGPSEGESLLREAVIEVTVRTGAAWDTTSFTLAKGASAEKEIGSSTIRFAPSSSEPDRELVESVTFGMEEPCDDLVQVRDQTRPLLEMEVGMDFGFMVTAESRWRADPRRDTPIAFPVTISIHRPRKPADDAAVEEHRLRFVIRDLPLGRAP